MKAFHYIVVIILALVSGMLGASLTHDKTSVAAQKESVSERVMRTRTLRCAYTVFPPLIIKDANTAAMSGIVYDIMEEMGKQLSLKIEWTAEVGPAGMFEGFSSNQYDAICVGYSRNPARAARGDFTNSMFYLPNSIYVRNDDMRFDADYSLLNSEDVRFNVVDGEVSNFTIKNDFPKAKMQSMGEGALSDASARLLSVMTKKSDAVIMDDIAAADFMKANPNQVKQLLPPVTVFTSSIIVPQNEYPLKATLDATIGSLNENGFIKRTILKYSDGYGYYMPADPFKLEKLHD